MQRLQIPKARNWHYWQRPGETPDTVDTWTLQVMGEGSAAPATAPQAGRTIALAATQARITPPPVWAVQRVSGAAIG